MVVFSDSIIYNLVLATVILAICFYLFFTSTFNYWKDRGIPYVKPVPFFGNLKDQFLSRKHLLDVHQDIYNQLQGNRYGGYFEMKKPGLLIRDPALVQRILIKDFTHFYDHGFPCDTERDPLSANLFNLEGEDWKCLRNKLTPTFTTGKLKGMFEQICKCGEEINVHIEKQSKKEKSLEVKLLMDKFALDVIASCAFGLHMDEDNEATKNYRDVVNGFFRPSKLEAFKRALLLILPKLARKIGIKTLPEKSEKFLVQIIRDTLKYRRDNNVNRNDFVQLMLNLQKQEQSGAHIASDIQHDEHDDDDDIIDQMKHTSKGQDEKQDQGNQKVVITEGCITAQSFVFLVGGSESVTGPLSFALYALSQHPQVQKKVQNEIDTVLAKHNNVWSYQVIKEMTYLTQVLQETFRIFPVGISLFRICTQTYKIPDSNDIIEKGTRVLIPMHAIHNDPANHKSPEVFDPDRFVNNNFKPSGTFLPFGDGPRICIAMRFALLEMKVAMSRIMSQYTVKLSSKTKVPFKYTTTSIIPHPEGGIWLEFDKRTKL